MFALQPCALRRREMGAGFLSSLMLVQVQWPLTNICLVDESRVYPKIVLTTNSYNGTWHKTPLFQRSDAIGRHTSPILSHTQIKSDLLDSVRRLWKSFENWTD